MNLDTRKYLEPLEKPNNPIASDWWIHRATPTTGDYVWRCVHVHKLSDAENEGAHNVYIDLLDINGKRIDSITDSIVIRYGWEENGVEFYTLGYGFDILFVRVFEVSGKIHHSIDKKIVNGFNAHGISEDDIEETL